MQRIKQTLTGKSFFLLHFISPFDIVNDNDSQLQYRLYREKINTIIL